MRGEDVEGFRVTWVDETHPLGRQRNAAGVKADGTFQIPRLRSVPHRLYVWRRGDPRLADLRAVLPGPPPLVIDLQEGLSIRGTCRPGPPTPWSRVIAERDGIEVDALVADDGSFAVFGLAPGPWKIDVTVKDATVERKSGPGLAIEAGRANVALGE